jgi:hypothetical protein
LSSRLIYRNAKIKLYKDYKFAHPAYSLVTDGPYIGGKAAGVLKLTTHLHVVPRLIIYGAIPESLPLYRSEICSATLWEGYRLSMLFENVVLRENFGHAREEVT